MGSLWKAAICLSVLVCFVACGGDKPAAKKKAAGKQSVAAKVPSVPKLPSLVDPEAGNTQEDDLEFVYNPTGLRDPYTPFLRLEVTKTKKKGVSKKVFVPKTPLQRYTLEELKLVGIVWAEERSKALIEDPKGKGYYVGAGTYVGDQGGKIIRILKDQLLVEERHTDMMGAENVKQITLTLHKSEVK